MNNVTSLSMLTKVFPCTTHHWGYQLYLVFIWREFSVFTLCPQRNIFLAKIAITYINATFLHTLTHYSLWKLRKWIIASPHVLVYRISSREINHDPALLIPYSSFQLLQLFGHRVFIKWFSFSLLLWHYVFLFIDLFELIYLN